MAEYVGKKVRKTFTEGTFNGKVTEWVAEINCWHIEYSDGDSEDVTKRELNKILVAEAATPGRKGRSAAIPRHPASTTSGGRKRGKVAEDDDVQPAKRRPGRPRKAEVGQGTKRSTRTGLKAASAPPGPAIVANGIDSPARKKVDATIVRADPTSGPVPGPIRFHNRVAYNGMVFIAGQTSAESDTYEGQAKEVLRLLEEQLLAAGSSKKHILKANVLLKDIVAGVATFNSIWEEWIDPEHAPARMTFEASLVAPELLVEVDAFAAVASDD